MSRPEAALERDILRWFGQRPDLLLCKNEVGSGITRAGVEAILAALPIELKEPIRQIASRHSITWGLGVGSPDLVGAVAGTWFAVELKSEGGRVSDTQRIWHDAAAKRGALVDVVRSEGEMAAAIERARARGRR